MAVLGVTGIALLQACYGGALGRLPVGIALLLEYTGVLFVALVGFFVFKEKVKARLWVAIGLVLAGLVVVAQLWNSTLDPLGVVLALGRRRDAHDLLRRRRAPGGGDLAARGRVLDRAVRRRVLGASSADGGR